MITVLIALLAVVAIGTTCVVVGMRRTRSATRGGTELDKKAARATRADYSAFGGTGLFNVMDSKSMSEAAQRRGQYRR